VENVPTSHAKPSSLLDTRVVYCGDNLEQLPFHRGIVFATACSPVAAFMRLTTLTAIIRQTGE
jgi:hypothetical protein